MVLPTPNKVTAHAPNDDALGALVASTYKSSTLDFYVNGTKIELSNPNPHWTLLDFIRSQDGLKGTKLGCGEGGCGACTVVLQTLDTHKSLTHLAVNACLFPLVGVVGKHVITVEGLGNVDHPHPLQERLAKLHGSQCGFCTPGIVMSLYALIRNSFDTKSGKFRLSEDDIEMKGHLDGNLCRCTGYKPILQAAKTFITEDLKGQVVSRPSLPDAEVEIDRNDELNAVRAKSSGSCGRPGGCCRDEAVRDPHISDPTTGEEKLSTDSSSDDDSRSSMAESGSTTMSSPDPTPTDGASYGKPVKSREKISDQPGAIEGTKTGTSLDASPPEMKGDVPQFHFSAYSPDVELIYPPALRKYQSVPICYGNEKKIWLRPLSLQQLVDLMSTYPSAKMVGGASEVQVEVRFKNSDFAVSIFVSDIEELKKIEVPEADAGIQAMNEVVIGANAPMTDVEAVCNDLFAKLGPSRASVLKAVSKQLRYFAGRQIRNVASIAGNIATASPISDLNPVLMAANATVIAKTQDEEVRLPMSSMFIGYRTTALPPKSVITKICIPLSPPDTIEVVKAYKQAKRKDDDIAIVNAGFRVRLKDGIVKEASLVYGGMAPMTVKARDTSALLVGKKWYDESLLDSALTALSAEFDLNFGVPGGMASYRKTLAMSMFFRFWHEVVADLKLGEVGSDLIEEIHRQISFGSRDNFNPHEQRVVGKQVPHLSSLKHATGEAEYVDDMPKQNRELFGALVMSSKAHARLVSVDWTSALGPGMALGYVDKHSIPVEANLWGSVVKDEPFFATDEVCSHGQPIGLVYAETALQAQAAARAVKVVYEDLPAILTIDEAIKANSYYKYGKELRKGAVPEKMDEEFAKCDRIFEGISKVGGQEHFYLETNAALVVPHSEDGSMDVWSSTQNT